MEYKKAFKSVDAREKVLDAYDEILQRWPVPYESLYVNTNYGETFVIKSRDSALPPLILLHGTSSNSAMWIGDVSEYSKHFCVYAIDIPGEPGKSEERQYSLKNSIYLDWLNEVLMKLKVHKVSIVGISLGAWLATGFAIKYSQKVEKLVLLSPSGIGRQKVSFMFKAIPYMLLGDWGFNKITQMVNGKQPIAKEAVEYSKLISKSFNLRMDAVPLYSDDELRCLEMAVLLLVGEDDVMLHSSETVKRISTLLPHANINLLAGHGHVLIGLNKKIMEFLMGR